MQTSISDSNPSKLPRWLLIAAWLGIVWNGYGAYQFVASFSQTAKSLMAAGVTQAQAELYLSLPAWISVVFAIGVVGGLIGSVALAMAKKVAVPVFIASLLGYVFLFAGDTYYGVFAAIPVQLVILATVVIIAAVLLFLAMHANKRGLLR